MVKFACVYCFDDNTLTVIGEKSKVLELLGTFEKKQDVRLKWGKNVYNGCIVKIGEDEEDMTKFATKAYAKILKKLTGKQSTVPEELFGFDHNSKTPRKRQHVQTEKMKESMKQNAEFSPRKKKASKVAKRDDEQQTKQKAQKQKKAAEANSHMLTNKEILDMACTSNDLADQFGCQESMERGPSPVPAEEEPPIDTIRQVCQSSSVQNSDNHSNKALLSKDDHPINAHHITCKNSNTVRPSSNDRQTIGDSSFGVACPSTEDIPFKPAPERDHPCPSSNPTDVGNPWISRSPCTERHRFSLHGHTGTSLTDTWALCTEQTRHYPEDFPPAVIELFRLVIRDDVQEYIRGVLHHRVANQLSYSELQDTNQDFSRSDHYGDSFREAPYIHSTPNKSREYIPQIPPQSPTLDHITYTDLTDIHQTSNIDGTIDHDMYALSQKQINSGTMLKSSRIINMNKHSVTYNTEQSATFNAQQSVTIKSSNAQSATSNTQSVTSNTQSTTSNTQSATSNTQSATSNIQSATSNTQSETFNFQESPRRSPRKHTASTRTTDQQQKSFKGLRKRVKLIKDSNLEAWEDDLRRATSAAEKAHPSRSGYVLTCKLIPCIFELEELAQSRGQGLRKKKETDLRPILDPTKLGDLKEYVNLWCHKNSKESVKELDFNDAISEKISYARRKLKTLQKQ